MYILGLTTLGDAAATLICDGDVVAAVEEERFSRTKHHCGFPYRAVEFCLAQAGIGIDAVEHVSLYWKPWILAHKIGQAAQSLAISPAMFAARVDRGVSQVSQSYLGMLGYPRRIREHFGPSDFRFHYLEHHTCHAASAFLVSPFERAAILTMDGTGEATTTMMALGQGNTLEPLKRIKLPHSLGQFYSAVTNFLGFDMFAGDEWKVMGLAAYGKPEIRGLPGSPGAIDRRPRQFPGQHPGVGSPLGQALPVQPGGGDGVGPAQAAGRGDQRTPSEHRSQRSASA